jgi:hypothetical protein
MAIEALNGLGSPYFKPFSLSAGKPSLFKLVNKMA